MLGVGIGHDVSAVDVGGHRNDAQGVAPPPLLLAQQLQAPCLHCRPGTSGQPLVALHNVVHALGCQHVEGLPQPEQQGQAGCVRGGAIFVGAGLPLPVEVHALHGVLLARCHGLLGDSYKAETSGERQSFLGAGHGHIHTPRVHLERQRPNGRHTVHQEEGIGPSGVHGLADAGQVGGDAGGRLVMHHRHRLGVLVGLQKLSQLLLIGALAPGAVNDVNVEAESLHHVHPQLRKHAVPECHDLITRVEGVLQGGLPSSCAGC
mmetsp:Transcript_9024/g.27049  ORF Transcript_9024/g.27049 Transcript_9024/m.27049 type:complete len:262 (-) Transcript_9024:478-1263(-)